MCTTFTPYMILFAVVVPVAKTVEVIHDTDHLSNAQYFDCLHYTNEMTNTYSIKYCIQQKYISDVKEEMNQKREEQCEQNGTAHSFSSLFEEGIHPNIVLLTFQSGIDQADRYGRYFSRREMNNSSEIISDDFVCNCSSLEGTFGRYCQYGLYIGSSIGDIVRATKINSRDDFMIGQFQRKRVCYEFIDCEYGLLCLDWREICNGAQNCMNGMDEENCDQVEMNECGQNEFRCQNGLCIPEEYWLDGEIDCQDASDELDQPNFENLCGNEKGLECDEHTCKSIMNLPCGDGNCVLSYPFAKLLVKELLSETKTTFLCSTLRDLAFQCELHEPLRFWTLADGFCMFLPGPWNGTTTAAGIHECEYLLKCRLSRGLSTYCPTDDILSTLLTTVCKSNGHRIKYPPGSLFGPRTYTFYKTNHQLTDGLLPDYAIIDGELRCPDFHLTVNEFELVSFIAILEMSSISLIYVVEWFLCNATENYTTETQFIRNYSALAPHLDTSCWHKWLLLFNLSSVAEIVSSCTYTCLSLHRIHDGVPDCLSDILDEETTILPIEHSKNHCLNCITHGKTAICLPTNRISFGGSICAQGEDTYITRTGMTIRNLKCTNYDTSECHVIRDYIDHSSSNRGNLTVTSPIEHNLRLFAFGQYCDTYFDTETGIDESVEHCLNEWICARNEYRCLTGQCIPFDWLCDGEWDCSDASDEQRLLLQVDEFIDEHNRLLLNFTEVKKRCFERYSKQAFSNLCNITLEYPCLLANVDDPLNFTTNRPCIKLEQIGDERADCLGKSDERNLLKCDSDVLGWNYGCTATENHCALWLFFCSDVFLLICSSDNKDKTCFYKKDSTCDGPNDVLCLNGTCQRNVRCNKKLDCLNGEDEYWCYFSLERYSLEDGIYRGNRRIEQQYATFLTEYLGISATPVSRLLQESSLLDRIEQIFVTINTKERIKTIGEYSLDNILIDELLNISRNDSKLMLKMELPFICNRGIPIKTNDRRTQCLCSASHYGDYCEFQANRVSVVTHLDLTGYNGNHTVTNDENSGILVFCTFRYEKRIIDRYEFHIQSSKKRKKEKFYFAYPRTTEFREQKQKQRNSTKLYSIRFEAFYLQPTVRPVLLAAWHFPIQFDFLPAFRFAKVLHLNKTSKNDSCHLACGSHGKCFRLENEVNDEICSCQNGWYGERCDQYEKQCDNLCHPHALCRPQHRGLINGDHRPACLCPHGWFGPTCHLTYPKCVQCQNGGSCYLTHDQSQSQPFQCICTNDFYGDHCQFSKHAVLLRFDRFVSNILAISIQYYDVQQGLIDLHLREQQVYIGQPSETRMQYEKDNAPSVILIKSYTEHHQLEGPRFHLIYSQQNPTALINMSTQLTSENECGHVHTLFHPSIVQNTDTNVLIFRYHELCVQGKENRSSIICFRDDQYFCLCNLSIQHAQCLHFDPHSDKCDYCLSGGQCIHGNVRREEDFICLCPRCIYGSVCQFSTQLFSFTLDSLIIKDVQTRRNLSIGIYVSIISLVFLSGVFNNVCNLVVFSCKTPRQVGVGNYLLFVSVINLLSLTILFSKTIYILLGIGGLLQNNTINLIWCKLLSSLLSITVRVNYWLISLITIERLLSAIFPSKIEIKKPKTAFLLSSITIVIVCGMHVHEFFYYTIISANPQEMNSSSIFCVTNFEHRVMSTYNYVNVLVHHLVPFIIQIIAITLLIVWAARSRARTTTTHKDIFSQVLKKQFRTQKELYLTPAVIIFAALPQMIFTSSFACTKLNHDWQRYSLLIAYLFSFIPQICAFLIFVLPSTLYKAEFNKTSIGQKLLCINRKNQNKAQACSSLITQGQQTRIEKNE